MQAIETKYLSATNKSGARIKATTTSGVYKIISYPYHLNEEMAHRKAAEALCKKLNWAGKMIAGSTQRGWVFVFQTFHDKRED